MRTAVFVCADEPAIGHAGADVEAINGLCDRPMQLAAAVDGGKRVVLLLHHARYDLAEVQKALRSADVDPLGAQILEVPDGITHADFESTVAGLRQRALAFVDSRPEHAKPVLRGDVTRRGLFKVPQPVYLAAPMVDHGTCAAVDGCRACVDVCPQGAYRWHQGRIHYNKDICEPCGRCVTTCPTDAISNPSSTPEMLSSQIRGLVEYRERPIGIRYVCSRASLLSATPDWHDVEVPCTGMVSGSWLITALVIGASAATAAPCSAGGCPLGLDEHSATAIDFARNALAAAALDPDLVPIEPAPVVETSLARSNITSPFTRAGDVEVVLALDMHGEEPLSLSHQGSSLGIVAIDSEACTLCAQCAQTCPTNAIQASYEGATVSLSFDAASCTNCKQCTIACPEIEQGAISVAGRVDTGSLRMGRQTINEGTVLVCEFCGKPIAPSSMMNRIGELLGEGFDETMSYLTRRCMDCRGLA